MAVLFSTEFNIPKETLAELGVFNTFLNEDSNFFINIKRLEVTNVPEFANGYEKVNSYFRNIGTLLKASRSTSDRMYREAFRRFNFPEVNGINLGFSSGTRGAGFGTQLRLNIIRDAYDIIHSGTEQPEIFHLVGLFEENVGPDRLSDMVARIIYDNIVAYTKRIYKALNINEETYPEYKFRDGIVINPYKRIKLLLLPVDLLHKLPIAHGWDDIDRVCRENEAIRAEINELIGDNWGKLRSADKKRYLRDWIFKNPVRACRIINSYKVSSIEQYDPLMNLDYLVRYLTETYITNSDEDDNSFNAAIEILDNYKEWVELHRGAIIIQEAPSRSKEKTVQRTLHAIALGFCKKYNWDISPETDSGRGPEDFKISRGCDKTVIEIKLTSNPDCVHGLEVQIEEYAKAENTDNKLFVLVNTGQNENRINSVLKKHEEMLAAGLNPAKVLVIDAKRKNSASTT